MKLRDGYRGELDVYGVVTDDLLLQILQLPRVLAAGSLHHIVKVKHSRLPTVYDDHTAQFRQSEERSVMMRVKA